MDRRLIYVSWRIGAEEGDVLLFSSDVSLLLGGALHSCHINITIQLRERKAKVQALDRHKCASFQRACHWAHLLKKKKQ